MTAPGLRERGLDPAHILSVANLAIGGVAGSPVHAVAVADSVRLCLPSRRAAGAVTGALTQVGYQVRRIGGTGRRDVRVTGWSAAGLEARLAALCTVTHQLETSPARTAAAAIDRVRRQPPSALADAEALAAASTRMRAFVHTHSGIHAPHNPAVLPADLDNALRLRAVWQLEAAIDGLIARHVQLASRALRLYRSLRQHVPDDQAERAALHRAGMTSWRVIPAPAPPGSAPRTTRWGDPPAPRPPGSARRAPGWDGGLAPGASPSGRSRASRVPGESPRFSRSAPTGERPGGAARPGARPGGPSRPGGRTFPAGRPGRRRR
jgi:hypothetical protein